MSLAVMMSTDKNAIICDLAETYGIFNYKALPVDTLAVLVLGLRADSRIKMKMNGFNTEVPIRALLAECTDMLTAIIYGHDENSQTWIGIMKSNDGEVAAAGFDSPEDFEAERRKYIKD